jgi:hypothetical protein
MVAFSSQLCISDIAPTSLFGDLHGPPGLVSSYLLVITLLPPDLPGSGWAAVVEERTWIRPFGCARPLTVHGAERYPTCLEV